MAAFFASGDVALLVLGCLSLELLILILVRKTGRISLPPVELLAAVSAGAALALALHEALRQAAWPHVAGWLSVALLCHLWDLKFRLATHRTG